MIVLCSDFLMTKESEQDSNIRWIADLLVRPIRRAVAEDVVIASKYFNKDWKFSRKTFFALSNIEVDMYSLHFGFLPELISDESISYLRRSFSEKAIVVGYEMSEQTKLVLDRSGLTYIDFWLHPVRFMDDVLFAFRSDSDFINNELFANQVKDDLINSYADRLRVQSYRGFSRSTYPLKPNSAVFVGQLMADKAVLHRGKMLNLLDFQEEFKRTARSYSHVYYARHPFLKSGDESVITFVRSFRNVSLINIPSYELLFSRETRHFFGISSSLITEASYFEKDTKFLFRPAVPVGAMPGAYASIFQEFLHPNFWARVLKPVLPSVVQLEPMEFYAKKDKLRDALSFYWGYRTIDKVEYIRENVGNLYKKSLLNLQ